MNSGFTFDGSGLEMGLQQYERQMTQAIKAYSETAALQLQNDARENARWTDGGGGRRSERARQRLTGTVKYFADKIVMTLSHGASYGIWLELAMQKNWAIIPETLRHTGTHEIMPGYQRLLGGMK